MRIHEHFGWTYVIYHKSKHLRYALLVSILPDLLSWGLWIPYAAITGIQSLNHKPVLTLVPDWIFTLYGITHSVVVTAFVFTIIYLLLKKIPAYLWAWPINIIIDIPLHSRDYLPTPFLWPVSDWKFPGISWSNSYFTVTNYILLIGSIVYINRGKFARLFRKQ